MTTHADKNAFLPSENVRCGFQGAALAVETMQKVGWQVNAPEARACLQRYY